MVSSMVWACLLAGALNTAGVAIPPASALLASTGPADSLATQRCPNEPAPGAVVADIPWPQHRYDLAALRQINDGSGVTVAVVDSGVDASHPQLAGAVRVGDDMLDGTGDGRVDCVGHGTAVASIIAARPVVGSGPRGLAPAARILPIRVSERVVRDDDVVGDGTVADLAAGIRAAVASRPRPAVINLSISTTRDSSALRAAVRAALGADIVVTAAVGNRHELGDPTPYPAGYEGVVGVGAVGPDGLRVPSSQTGSYVDIVAPGDAVVAATPGRGHQAYQGTSFAVAFVTATAALIRARWPRLSQGEVVRRLLATADPSAGARPSAEYGYGVLNPMRAMTEIVTPRHGAALTAASPFATAASPFAGGARRAPVDVRSGPKPAAIGATVILVISAVALASVAAITPLGRRRRWRPGRIE